MRRIFLAMFLVLLFPIISLAGWESDETGTRYMNSDGTYKVGWCQDIDGKWYYLDDSTGYVLKNMSTPDGYVVGENGEWIDGEGDNQSMSQYNNKKEFTVSAYKAYSSQQLNQFGTSFPVTVYYNDKYEYSYFNDKKLQIEIDGLEVSNEGVLYVTFSANEKNYYHELNAVTHYSFEDGTYKDVNRGMGTWGEEMKSEPIMNYRGMKTDPKPISAEVYIDVADVE